jgi:MinD-like ATPase involved in chromosome partitioning or flagellar assembly
MSDTQSDAHAGHRAETLALLSGKGGSGKTVVALAMARVLAEAGLKVLLIDCDLATHGATYFMETEFSEPTVAITSTTALLLNAGPENSAPMRAKAGFEFVPSLVDPSARHQHPSQISRELDGWWNNAVRNYDAIILDCQAGFSEIAEWAATRADRKLMVLEPDAVSAAALRVLSLQLGYSLKSSSTWQVFNKLTEEERPVYERVAGGTLFTNLPPLPFDWQVRAAFALREIPGVLSTSSAFGLGILRIMHTLFPRFAKQLASLETKSVGDWYDSLRTKIERLRGLRSRIRYESMEARRRQRARTAALASGLLGIVGALLALYPVMRMSKYALDPRILPELLGLLLLIAAPIIYWQSLRGLWAEREQDSAQEELAKAEHDIEKFETLIATDPRLREYAKNRGEADPSYGDDDRPEASGPPTTPTRASVASKGAEGGEYRERPSPREIYDKVQELPILSRKEYEASYVGHLVRWPVTLAAVNQRGGAERAMLMAQDGDHFVPHIICEISVSDHPQLKRLRDGAPLVIRGKIADISGTEIQLEDVKLTFPE